MHSGLTPKERNRYDKCGKENKSPSSLDLSRDTTKKNKMLQSNTKGIKEKYSRETDNYFKGEGPRGQE